MEIRPYIDNDYPQLEAILKETGLFLGESDQRETLQKQSAFDRESILVAEEQGDLIGGVFLLYTPWSSTIRHLFVHPNYQRKGIGAELLQAAEKTLKGKGAEKATLYVCATDPTVKAFCKKRGWKEYPTVIPLHKDL